MSSLGVALEQGAEAHRKVGQSLQEIARRSEAWAYGMDFRLLYDNDVRFFNIGYNVSADRIDAHHYDLLATEARLASFFAISKGDVSPEHWLFLGRSDHQAVLGAFAGFVEWLHVRVSDAGALSAQLSGHSSGGE